jgi:DeoR/GlpR family transcriptional regulator of sugar metabolism
MLTSARKNLLLERLSRDGQLTVTPLAAELGISEDTLRRDLRDLASQGKLVRVHGGAVPASPTHRPVEERRELHAEEKTALARKAVALIDDGMVVIVDGGTTHAALAQVMPRERRCTVVTHSPAIAASFEFHGSVEIHLIGGRVFRHSMVAMGPDTGEAFARVTADLCLLGVTGVHPDRGLTTGDGAEAALKRIMSGAAAEAVVLATHDKLGQASPWQIAQLEAISTLVTSGRRPDWLPDGVAHLTA